MFAVAYNKLYRSELLKKQKVRFMEMLPHEDLVFNLRAFSFAERIGFIPDSSPYHYLCRDEMSAAGSFFIRPFAGLSTDGRCVSSLFQNT